MPGNLPGTGTKGTEVLLLPEDESFLILLGHQGGEHKCPGHQASSEKEAVPMRRNQKRKELFLKKKAEESEQQVKETPKHVDRTFKCDQCERTFSTENGLNIHTGRAHKNSNLPPPERLLNSSGKEEPKQVSPIKDIIEEEKDDEDSSVESEEESIEETNTPTCNLCGSTQCIRLTAISIRCSSTPVYHKKCPF